MKHIELLPDIELTDIEGDVVKDKAGTPQVRTHREFIKARLADPQWGQSTDWLFAAVEVRRVLNSLPDDARSLPIENDHHKKLAAVTRNPSPHAPYNPNFAMCLVPFIKAVLRAKDELEEDEA